MCRFSEETCRQETVPQNTVSCKLYQMRESNKSSQFFQPTSTQLVTLRLLSLIHYLTFRDSKNSDTVFGDCKGLKKRISIFPT